MTPHTVRLAAATWMAMRGVPMVEICRFLGYGDLRVTQRVYAKYEADYLRNAVAALTGS